MLEAGDKRAITTATMRKWRKAVPPHFDFCVVVGPNVAKLKASAALDEELAAAQAAVDTLQARCLMIRTPADVTPGNVWRDRMARLLERVRRDATRVVWEPRGVWEVGDAALAAKKWDIVLAVDAARDPVPAGPVAYTRLRALGRDALVRSERARAGRPRDRPAPGRIRRPRDRQGARRGQGAPANRAGGREEGGGTRARHSAARCDGEGSRRRARVMARTRAVAMASEGSAADAATAALAKGNAVDAVVAGVFAAAATSPSVLLGPVQILLGGAGLGLRAVDGRVRQAGKGAPRPRGFTPEQGVAPAARVGVPTLPGGARGRAGEQRRVDAGAGDGTGDRASRRRAEGRAPEDRAARAVRRRRRGHRGRAHRRMRSGRRRTPDARRSRGSPSRHRRGEGGDAPRFHPASGVRSVARGGRLRQAKRGVAPRDGCARHCCGRPSRSRRRGLLRAPRRRHPGRVARPRRPVHGLPRSPRQAARPPGAPAPASAPMALIRSTTESALDMALAIACDPDAERRSRRRSTAWSKDAYDTAPAYEGQGALIGVVRTNGAVSALARRGGVHTGSAELDAGVAWRTR